VPLASASSVTGSGLLSLGASPARAPKSPFYKGSRIRQISSAFTAVRHITLRTKELFNGVFKGSPFHEINAAFNAIIEKTSLWASDLQGNFIHCPISRYYVNTITMLYLRFS
jgi:hypothetical protein